MNKLIVPKITFAQTLKDLFNDKRRAMSSTWFRGSLFLGVLAFFVIFIFLGVLLPELMVFIIVYSAVAGFVSSIIQVRGARRLREEIIADMESAESLTGVFNTNDGQRQNGTYIGKVSTMAGVLTFISSNGSSLDIEKKHGKLFDYYVYHNTELIEQKDLRKFVAIGPDVS